MLKNPLQKERKKTKGGKIIKKTTNLTNTVVNKQPNVILHLKCNSKDLDQINNFNVKL